MPRCRPRRRGRSRRAMSRPVAGAPLRLSVRRPRAATRRVLCPGGAIRPVGGRARRPACTRCCVTPARRRARGALRVLPGSDCGLALARQVVAREARPARTARAPARCLPSSPPPRTRRSSPPVASPPRRHCRRSVPPQLTVRVRQTVVLPPQVAAPLGPPCIGGARQIRVTAPDAKGRPSIWTPAAEVAAPPPHGGPPGRTPQARVHDPVGGRRKREARSAPVHSLHHWREER